MIWINKQQEPASWRAYRLTPNAMYEAKPELRDALLKDQGYICAYCMRGIPADDSPYENATSKIEHVLSREKHEDMQLNYNNMVVCCSGRMMGATHCDASKGQKDIFCSPLSQAAMQTIAYKTDGTILSSNATYNMEINDVLKLNIDILKSNRKEAWKSVRDYLLREENWNLSTLRKLLRTYESIGPDGKKREYCGIVIYMLKKKLHIMECKSKKS